MRRCTCFDGGEGWERFLEYHYYTWDYVVEAGVGDPTKEETEAILRLGYYGKKITKDSVEAIARGEYWSPAKGSKYAITGMCVDGAIERSFDNLTEVAEYVRARLDEQRNVSQGGFGTDYCNYEFHGFTMSDLGLTIGPDGYVELSGFGRRRYRR